MIKLGHLKNQRVDRPENEGVLPGVSAHFRPNDIGDVVSDRKKFVSILFVVGVAVGLFG